MLGDFSQLPPRTAQSATPAIPLCGEGHTAMLPEQSALHAADCVGCLRSAHAKYPRDPSLARLITELHSGSAHSNSCGKPAVRVTGLEQFRPTTYRPGAAKR
ncbi:hypothetical protein [Nocardia spumae]|uniref:hypothetical protein n=1 Tax=Nocardia spumae TaxID=2887190 RepID=UPI001D1552DB